MRNEITIDGRELLASVRIGVRMPRALGLRVWAATKLIELAALVSGFNVAAEVPNKFDPDDAATWMRYSETTPEGGKVVLVRYPEGFRLRYDGETVWRRDA